MQAKSVCATISCCVCPDVIQFFPIIALRYWIIITVTPQREPRKYLICDFIHSLIDSLFFLSSHSWNLRFIFSQYWTALVIKYLRTIRFRSVWTWIMATRRSWIKCEYYYHVTAYRYLNRYLWMWCKYLQTLNWLSIWRNEEHTKIHLTFKNWLWAENQLFVIFVVWLFSIRSFMKTKPCANWKIAINFEYVPIIWNHSVFYMIFIVVRFTFQRND